MENFSLEEKLLLLQYAIKKYEDENTLINKLRIVLDIKDIDRGLDTLIGTQKVRRIGPDILQNNVSHIGELPELPLHLQQILDTL